MATFVDQTNALTAELDSILAATSWLDWKSKLNAITPALNAWKREFAARVPTEEEYDAIIDYTSKLTEVLMKGKSFETAAAAGGKRRKYTRRYCKKTPCRRMGFTQKASCRPYKNCYRSTRS